MCDIFFFGNITDEFKNFSASVLSESYSVHSWDGAVFNSFGEGYDLNIYYTSELKSISSPFQSVVILCGDIIISEGFKTDNNVVFIVNSSEAGQIESVTKFKLPAITCGNSSMDTVSFSSIGDDELTVSLNREITALSGRSVSPFELPMHYSEQYELYPFLSLFALRVILDNYNSELGKLY